MVIWLTSCDYWLHDITVCFSFMIGYVINHIMVLSYANRCSMNFMNLYQLIYSNWIWCLPSHVTLIVCATATHYHPRYGRQKILAPEHHTAKHCCGGRAPRLLTSLLHELKPSQTSQIHGPHRKVLFLFSFQKMKSGNPPPQWPTFKPPNPSLSHRSPPGAKRPGGGTYEHLGVHRMKAS